MLLQVSECGWKPSKAPALDLLFSICKNMAAWLRQSSKNVCVVHCQVSATSCVVYQLCSANSDSRMIYFKTF